MKSLPCAVLAVLAACGPISTSPVSTPDLAPALPTNCRQDSNDPRYAYCSGAFQSGGAAGLCPSGYSLVSSQHMASMNFECDQNSKNFNIFYAVNVSTWADPQNSNNTACQQQTGWKIGLEGCGFFSTPIPGWVVQAQSSGGCMGWNYAIICQDSADWTCPQGTLATATNKNPKFGVVCFKA